MENVAGFRCRWHAAVEIFDKMFAKYGRNCGTFRNDVTPVVKTKYGYFWFETGLVKQWPWAAEHLPPLRASFVEFNLELFLLSARLNSINTDTISPRALPKITLPLVTPFQTRGRFFSSFVLCLFRHDEIARWSHADQHETVRTICNCRKH